MSQAIVVPAAFNGQVASVFQGQQATGDLSGGITGGYGLLKYRGKVWSIQHNGNSLNLMRDDGDGPRGSVDVVVLNANPNLSKTFYINGWDENNTNPPDCASANGIVPDQGVPHKQANACLACPRNAWGSAPNGGKGKACGDHRRMAIVPLTDLRNETFGGPLLLRCPAASLQDLAAFESRYSALGYPYFTMGIKIGFDPAESYPKFTFQAIRPLNDVEGTVVLEMRNSPEVARVIHEGTGPAQAAVAAPAQATFLEAAPAQQMAQQPQVQVRPAAQPAPAPVAAPAVAQPVQPVAVGGATAGGFGPAAPSGLAAVSQPVAQPAPAVVQQPVAQPAPVAAPQPAPVQHAAPAPQPEPATAAPQAPRAQVEMTGFGAVTPEVTQQPAQPAPVQPAPVPAGVVTAFEGSIDDRLNALLG
jgi:hypothetical protein